MERMRNEARVRVPAPADDWLIRSEAYLVDTIDGDAVGVVEEVQIDRRTGEPIGVDVSSGWFGRRLLSVPASSIVAIVPSARKIFVAGGVLPRRRDGAQSRRRRLTPRVLARPVEQFLAAEAGSASLLLAAAVAALLWANLGGTSYERFWNAAPGFLSEVHHGPAEGLRLVVNDLLMAVFFFVVALEVKREIIFGTLRDRHAAAVPVAAAFGTMAGAAATYVAVNLGGDLRGWAIPIATDIAFAIAALGLVGRRAPHELRVFLLTLAVVDDLGTIAVIALFFAKDVALVWLAVAAVIVVGIFAAHRSGLHSLPLHIVLAGLLWFAIFESGVHATIAGVVVGFLTPAAAGAARRRADPAAEAASPLARLEGALHPWSAYAVLPLFALANAGVPISPEALRDALTGQIGLGILLGLVVGAPLGGIVLARAAVAFTPARVPDGLDWPTIAGVAPLKGIGFTVAIFITGLTFDEPALQNAAVLAILVASAAAGVIGVAALRLRSARGRTPGARGASASA